MDIKMIRPGGNKMLGKLWRWLKQDYQPKLLQQVGLSAPKHIIYRGATFLVVDRDVALRGEIPNFTRCDECSGDGWDADPGGVFDCPRCNGSGSLSNHWIRSANLWDGTAVGGLPLHTLFTKARTFPVGVIEV